jgi:hypothetical protein
VTRARPFGDLDLPIPAYLAPQRPESSDFFTELILAPCALARTECEGSGSNAEASKSRLPTPASRSSE